MLALYAFEFRSRPRWLIVVATTLILIVAGAVMLVLGGPVPWFWCVIWIAGALWGAVPAVTQLWRNVRNAEQRDKQGDILESAFDSKAMWVRNGHRFNRFEFSDYVMAFSRSGRFAILKPLAPHQIAVVLPAELIPDDAQRPARFFRPSRAPRRAVR